MFAKGSLLVTSSHRVLSPTFSDPVENKYDQDMRAIQARASKIVHTEKEAIIGGTSSHMI
jgi:hypothetical protein